MPLSSGNRRDYVPSSLSLEVLRLDRGGSLRHTGIAMHIQALTFEPIFKRRIWGGQRLREVFAKDIPEDQPIGESWELADLPGDKSVVATGPLKGTPIDELVRRWGPQLTGRAALFEGSFPLLIKFLDAQQDLSVQVHPDAAMAHRLGGAVRVKHEAWYVLATTGDAAIYRGLQPGVTRDEFSTAIAMGNCAELLQRIPVRPGDCHYLPSGTVHALGAGVLVAEIQTPSDVTYRVFDWNRVDPRSGRPRELHVEQALQCIHFGTVSEEPHPRSHVGSYWTTVTRLVTCESFVIEKVRMVAGLEQRIPYAEPVVWIVLQGRGQVHYGDDGAGLNFGPGDTILLPAELPNGQVALQEDAVWLEVTIPTRSDLADYERPSRESLRAPQGSPESPIQLHIDRESH